MCGSFKARIFHHAVQCAAFNLLRAMSSNTKVFSCFRTKPNIVFFAMAHEVAAYLSSLLQELCCFPNSKSICLRLQI